MDLYTMRNEISKGKSIYELPLRVTYYARVSTEKFEQLNSLQNQVNYYSNFIRNNKNWTFVEGYIDEGISGTSVNKRDSFLKMIDDAKLGKFDFIITKEISRFSRNTLDSIQYTQELLRAGVGVFFQSDNINTLLPDSELRLTIMSSIAQDEVRKLSERVKFGFKRAIENGRVLGNHKIWGYRKDDGKLVIDEEQAKIIRMIFELYATGNMGIRRISQELADKGYYNSEGNPFAFTTIKGIILNPKYKGYYCGRKTQKYDYRNNDRKVFDKDEWIMYEDNETVPPIVSEELWDRANMIYEKRKSRAENGEHITYTNKYSYSGKIICMNCGCNYQRKLYRYASGDKELWQCKNHIEKGKDYCKAPSIYTTELDEIIRQCYEKIVIDKAKIVHDLLDIYSSLSEQSEIKQDISKNQNKINEILKRKDKLLDLSLDGRISNEEFEKRNNSFNEEIDSIKKEIEALKEQDIINENMKQSIEGLRKIITSELDFKEGFDSSIIDNLIEKIEIYQTEDKNKINLKVYLKLIGDPEEYIIARSKKNTSVCNRPFILQVTNRSVEFPRISKSNPAILHCNFSLYISIQGN